MNPTHSAKLGLRARLLAANIGMAFGVACAPAEPPAPPPPAPPPAEPVAAPAPAPAPEPAAQAEAPKPPPPIVVKDVGLQTPESILYVPDEDIYLVSNINGSPTEADANGFISKISPDGKVIELKWIDGSKPDVNLDAPKGMAIAGDILYVADIKWVRLFNRKTGKPMGKVGVGGATFLNGVAPAADGKGVWLSDSGMVFGEDGAKPTNTDGVYLVTNMQAKAVKKDKEMGWPNGLLATPEGTWVLSYKSNELYYLTKDGKKEKAQNLPKGSLDGIEQAKDGSVLVSSWEGKAIYQGRPGQEFKEVVSGVESPADIGYDPKRNRVLIPLFTKNELQFHTLLGGSAEPTAAAAPAATTTPAQNAAANPATGKPAPAAGGAGKPSEGKPAAGAAATNKPAPAGAPPATPAKPPAAAQ